MGKKARLIFVALTALLGGIFLVSIAEARDEDDCRTAWARAVRSYLTQNRKAGPDGKVPKDMDEAELAAQAWNAAFKPACKLEAGGQKADARIEAAMIGVQLLSKLDPRGCVKFMDTYMESSRAEDICGAAKNASTADLRTQIRASIPERK